MRLDKLKHNLFSGKGVSDTKPGKACSGSATKKRACELTPFPKEYIQSFLLYCAPRPNYITHVHNVLDFELTLTEDLDQMPNKCVWRYVVLSDDDEGHEGVLKVKSEDSLNDPSALSFSILTISTPNRR